MIDTNTYKDIDKNIYAILTLVRSHNSYHLNEYVWLMAHRDEVLGEEFQHRYMRYWRMQSARLSASFCREYFSLMHRAKDMSLKEIIHHLHNIPTQKNNRHSLQLSFSTKLYHTLHPNYPIYDSMVRDFYGFKVPASNKGVDERVESFLTFYESLTKEYKEIKKNKILSLSIERFKCICDTKNFTDEKIIDSLIWASMLLRVKER